MKSREESREHHQAIWRCDDKVARCKVAGEIRKPAETIDLTDLALGIDQKESSL